MKFEKLTDNKIRITLNNQDLIEKNIDFNSFLSNSTETQDLFLSMLEEAEQKMGFVTKDHQIKVEALAMANGNYILTITRFKKNSENNNILQSKSRKVLAKKKDFPPNAENLVYSFNTFEDFSLFVKYTSKLNNFTTIAKTIILYYYNDKYYLAFTNINSKHPQIKKFYTLITEFGKYENHSDLLSYKLSERGKIIFKNNALKLYLKYFESSK